MQLLLSATGHVGQQTNAGLPAGRQLTVTRRSLSRESCPLTSDCRLITAFTNPQNWVLVVAFQHTSQLYARPSGALQQAQHVTTARPWSDLPAYASNHTQSGCPEDGLWPTCVNKIKSPAALY